MRVGVGVPLPDFQFEERNKIAHGHAHAHAHVGNGDKVVNDDTTGFTDTLGKRLFHCIHVVPSPEFPDRKELA